MRRSLIVFSLLAAALAGLFVLRDSTSKSAHQESGPPNILLITLDTTRADLLGTYGFFWDTSPNIDRVADEAIVFENCLAPNPTTLPSHTSLLTATAPTEHGVVMNVGFGGERFVPSEKLITFAQYAQSIGYTTSGFISAAPLRKGMGLEHGFETWSEMPDKQRERRATETIDDWMTWHDGYTADSHKPFFSWIHLYDAHNPFRPPAPYNLMFRAGTAMSQWLQDRHFARVSYRDRDQDGNGVPIGTRNSIEQYAGEIRYMDHELGRVFERLRASSQWNNTVVIITADHGEGLGQHNAPGHGGLLWNEQLHIPLIIKIPGESPRREKDLIWSVHTFPTILERITLADEDKFLAQATQEFKGSGINSNAAFSEVGEGHRAITTSNYKYIAWNDNSHSLFARGPDPFELTDIAANDEKRATDFNNMLRSTVSQFKVRGEALGSGSTEPMSSEQVDLLRALGYIENGDVDTPQPQSKPTTNEQSQRANPGRKRKVQQRRAR